MEFEPPFSNNGTGAKVTRLVEELKEFKDDAFENMEVEGVATDDMPLINVSGNGAASSSSFSRPSTIKIQKSDHRSIVVEKKT